MHPSTSNTDRLGGHGARWVRRWSVELPKPLAAGLLRLGVPLTYLELRVALANHVNPAPSSNDLAVRMTVLQRTNATYDFHL
jgi:hypothetical protein